MGGHRGAGKRRGRGVGGKGGDRQGGGGDVGAGRTPRNDVAWSGGSSHGANFIQSQIVLGRIPLIVG